MRPLENCLYHRDDIRILTSHWKWTAKEPWPPVKMVLGCALWKGEEYAEVRDRLSRPLPNPTLEVSGELFTINSSAGAGDAAAVPGTQVAQPGQKGIIHVIPLKRGVPIPETVSDVKFRLGVVELRPDLSPTVHSLLVRHVTMGMPLLVCGTGVLVKGMVDELIETMGEKPALNVTIQMYQKHSGYEPMMGCCTAVTVLSRTALGFLVCSALSPWAFDHSSTRIPSPLSCSLPQLPNVFTIGGEGWLHNVIPTEVVGWFLRKLAVKQSEWLLVLGDSPCLVAGLTVRSAMGFNVIYGAMYLTRDMGQQVTELCEKIQSSIKDCNSVPPIEWEWAVA